MVVQETKLKTFHYLIFPVPAAEHHVIFGGSQPLRHHGVRKPCRSTSLRCFLVTLLSVTRIRLYRREFLRYFRLTINQVSRYHLKLQIAYVVRLLHQSPHIWSAIYFNLPLHSINQGKQPYSNRIVEFEILLTYR